MVERNEYILEVKGITKSFPGVKALKGVDFRLKKGEIHALIGENGAGKSTLMKIILGSYTPTSGEMFFKGERYAPSSPGDALSKGISMIHQEISLVPTVSVSENTWIGRERQFGNRVFINKKKQEEATRNILNRVGLDIAPDTEVDTLSVAQMQLVEIARAMSYDSDVIIMDEPTSALTNAEIDKLYKVMRELVSQGASIIFISHKLEEILHICDSVTVFRDGEFIEHLNAQETSKEELIRYMVGRELKNAYPKEDVEIGKPAFEVENLSKKGVFKNITFSVHEGEILGFAGLMGAGRTEIMRALFGVDSKDSGIVKLYGKEIKVRNTHDAVQNRMSLVTEDRLRCGAIHELSVKFNSSIAYIRKITKAGFVNRKREIADVTNMVQKMAVKMASLDGEMGQLSGGNQQKVIIAKWMLTDPEILILDEPTRGIDVGAKAEIYKLVGQLAKQGKAIIFVSSELPELMGVSDRILVIKDGEIVAEYSRKDFDQECIMTSAFGA